jgi:hypothetical protein
MLIQGSDTSDARFERAGIQDISVAMSGILVSSETLVTQRRGLRIVLGPVTFGAIAVSVIWMLR